MREVVVLAATLVLGLERVRVSEVVALTFTAATATFPRAGAVNPPSQTRWMVDGDGNYSDE